MNHLHLDPFSGIAGDMMLGALIDLGADLNPVREALAALPIDDAYELTAERAMRQSIAGIDFKVHLKQTNHARSHTHEHTHSNTSGSSGGGHRHYSDLMKLVQALSVQDVTKDRCRRVVTVLAEAEAAVHDIAIDRVHFHEVGALDSIIDMFGSCMALEQLEVETLSSGPLPITRGYVQCDHGLMPVPAPATLRLMQGIPTVGLDRKGELVTPTGAALVRGLCETFGAPPAMVVERVGYGAGDHDFAEAPNLLRAVLGKIR